MASSHNNAAPGSRSCCRVLRHGSPSTICPIPSQSSSGGRCTGPLSAHSSPLSISPSGLSAGEYLRALNVACPQSSDHDFLFRLPFYWEVKTLFLLYLSLPQTQVRFLEGSLLASSADRSILRAPPTYIKLICTHSWPKMKRLSMQGSSRFKATPSLSSKPS